MFVICSLGSEDSADAIIAFSETKEIAVKCIQNSFHDANAIIDWDFKAKNNRVARCDYTEEEQNNRWFTVYEVFEIPDDTNFITVWWHGYDGVDFVVTPFVNITDAIEDWEKDYKNAKANGDEVITNLDFLFDDRESYDFCIDIGNEWECCQIVNVREVREV